MRPAIFLDRDGTINEDAGDLFSMDKLRFIPGALESMKRLQGRYMLFIITNQPAIGKGVATEEQYLKFKSEYEAELRRHGIEVVETLHCPHTKEAGCECRKPSPYFPSLMQKKHGLDLGRSFVIGDHPSDMQLGWNIGARTAYVLTGHGAKHEKDMVDRRPDFVGRDINEAAEWVLGLKR